MKNKNIFLIALLPFVFTACISITKELPASKTYTLNLKESVKHIKNTHKSIYIQEPRTIQSLNTHAIIYTKENLKDKYALSKWSDKPSKMIQQLIAKALIASNNYKYITTNRSIDYDYEIKSNLVDFQQVFEKNNSYSLLTINVFFIDRKNNITYFKNFTYKNENKKANLTSFIDSMNSQVTKFLGDLNYFLIKKSQI